MKKTTTKVSTKTLALLVLISVGIIFTLGVGVKKAYEKEASEMKGALERHLELFHAGASYLRPEMLTLETIPKERREKARNKLYRDLLEVTTEDYAKRAADSNIGHFEYLEQVGERITDGGVNVLAIEDVEFESPDKAYIIAIVWWGSKYGKINQATKKIEPFHATDFTTVNRYPMQKIDGKWKVSGIGTTVKGVPMDDDENTYGPPTPEEAIKMFENMSYTWDEKIRRGIPLGGE